MTMRRAPTQGELADFAGFCRNATDAQLEAIERQEREANRPRFAEVAAAERERRKQD